MKTESIDKLFDVILTGEEIFTIYINFIEEDNLKGKELEVINKFMAVLYCALKNRKEHNYVLVNTGNIEIEA